MAWTMRLTYVIRSNNRARYRVFMGTYLVYLAPRFMTVDNLLLYVLDGHNTGRGDALDVVASQHLITAHDVVLTLFPSELGHPL